MKKINYENIKAMKASSPEDGTIGIVSNSETNSIFKYYSSAKNWVLLMDAPPTLVSHDPDIINENGNYLTTITQDTSSDTVQNTDVLLSDCAHQTLLSATVRDLGNVGSWYCYVDSHGSTVSPTDATIREQMATDGNLKVTLSLKGDPTQGLYPFGGVGFDFVNNGTKATSAKETVDVSSYTGFLLRYSSDGPFFIKLSDAKGDDGATYMVELPGTAGVVVDKVLAWSDFAQPSWASGAIIRELPSKALIGLQIQQTNSDTDVSFTLYRLQMQGTGALVPCGITPKIEYKAKALDMIDQWLDRYYLENSDNTLARIRWVSGNNNDPELTVSEGIGYGMLLCVSAATTMVGDTYHEKFKKLYAYWNVNLDAKGLMNWKVSGFGSTAVGTGSATDADIDVALALLLAYEKFMDVSYLTEALTMLNKIWNNEVFTTTVNGSVKNLLAPGDQWTTFVNPSYVDLGALFLFRLYDKEHDWSTVYEHNLELLQKNQAHSTVSLPSNWCDYEGAPVIGLSSLGYGYDACRVPARMYRAYKWTGDKRIYEYLANMSTSAELRSAMLSADPLSSLRLSISQSGVFGSDVNSDAVSSIVLAFMQTASLTDPQLESILTSLENFSSEESDYFNFFVKIWTFTSATSVLKRYSTAYAGTTVTAYLIHVQEPEVSGTQNAMQISVGATTGDIRIRVKVNGVFSNWTAIQADTTSDGKVAVKEGDTPDYLPAKLISSDSSLSLEVTEDNKLDLKVTSSPVIPVQSVFRTSAVDSGARSALIALGALAINEGGWIRSVDGIRVTCPVSGVYRVSASACMVSPKNSSTGGKVASARTQISASTLASTPVLWDSDYCTGSLWSVENPNSEVTASEDGNMLINWSIRFPANDGNVTGGASALFNWMHFRGGTLIGRSDPGNYQNISSDADVFGEYASDSSIVNVLQGDTIKFFIQCTLQEELKLDLGMNVSYINSFPEHAGDVVSLTLEHKDNNGSAKGSYPMYSSYQPWGSSNPLNISTELEMLAGDYLDLNSISNGVTTLTGIILSAALSNPVSAGGGSSVTALSELSDVSASSAVDGQVLQYNATSKKWEAASHTSSGTELDGVYTYPVILSNTEIGTSHTSTAGASYYSARIIPAAIVEANNISCFFTQDGSFYGVRMGIYEPGTTSDKLIAQTALYTEKPALGVLTLPLLYDADGVALTQNLFLTPNKSYMLALIISANSMKLAAYEGLLTNAPNHFSRFDVGNARGFLLLGMSPACGYSAGNVYPWMSVSK